MNQALPKFFIFLIAFLALVTTSKLTNNTLHVNLSHLKTVWGVIAAVFVLCLWIFYNYKNQKIFISKSIFYLPILGFLSWCFVTLLWVENYYLAFISLIQYTSFVLIFFLVINVLPNKKDVFNLFNALVAALFFVSIVGLLQYYYSDNVFIQNLFFQVIRPASTFVNKNMAAHFVVMMLPLSAVLFLITNNSYKSTLYWLVTFFSGWFLIETLSRQAYLAMLVEIAFFVLFFLLDYHKNKKKSLLMQSGNISKGISIAVMIFTLFFVSNVENIDNSFGINTHKYENRVDPINIEAGNKRYPMWINTFEMIKDNPIIGVGIGQWYEHYPYYYDRVEKDLVFHDRVKLKRLHNEYIEIFSNVGAVGYSFLFWLLFLIVSSVWKYLVNQNNDFRLLLFAPVLGLIGFAVLSVFSFPITVYTPAFMALVFLAIISTILSKFENNTICIKIKKPIHLILIFFSAMLLFWSVYISYRWISAEHYFIQSVGHYSSGDFDKSLKIGKKALFYNSKVTKYNQIVAKSLINQGNFKSALPFLEKANNISPFKANSLLDLQLVYAQIGDIVNQEKTLRYILDNDKRNVRASVELVNVLFNQGKYREATDWYKKAKNNFEYFKNRNGFGPYHESLSRIALIVKDYKYFAYIYDNLISKTPKAEDYVVYGIVEYQYLNNKTKAKQLLEKAIELDSNIDIPEDIKTNLGLE
jgi:tetratricopeptide (TPR) repeat protein